jgi:hypothetical protein
MEAGVLYEHILLGLLPCPHATLTALEKRELELGITSFKFAARNPR